MKNALEKLKEIVKNAEEEWENDIENTKNPILKMVKRDMKQLVKIQAGMHYFEAMYGVKLELKFPKEPEGKWAKSVVEKLCQKKLKKLK